MGAAMLENTPLLPIEQLNLRECEEVIEKGLTTFYNVGNALLKIRDGKLYRDGHKTFEEYCRERWNMAIRTAYQYIESAKVIENVRNCAEMLPATESQARPLTSLPPDQQREVWQEAVKTAPGVTCLVCLNT